ncbi:hypothetical protein GUJ93_ZPchr0008g11465 [Zizania palustris]|uniref:Uncharacterized protein n=1 Tax=Zizania palustris TaxID=103762 RepID=A0A8J5R8A1_ZIZPA|nr:hypothetical protein GUJ93_ZPchr0008g11465 [Zizania palustris]
MDATTAKRKRPAVSDIPADEVSDAEVEEFYAILRRMRDATRRLCSGARARRPPRSPAWKPSFSLEDFADPQLARPPPPRHERVSENTTPPPDTPAAPAPATPRSPRFPA